MELNTADLREILRVFAESDMRDLHIEVGDTKLHVNKDGAAVATPRTAPMHLPEQRPATPPAAATAAPTTAPAEPVDVTPVLPDDRSGGERPGLVAVRAPAVGVFYRRPTPDSPPYVEPGAVVVPETPVCTIEVMKMFTEVVAGCAGTVVEICADNEQLVEHGQVLVYVDPS